MRETMEQHAEVFNETLALSSVGGDRDFLAEVVGLVQAAWPTLLADIREGLERGNLSAVGMTARLAKAAARNVSAKRAYESAVKLEAMAAIGDLEGARGASKSLEREVERLQAVLPIPEHSEYSA